MKIVAIRGKNLASLEDFAVDLDGEWMESAGIFAITGPTGSGKSTILDAVSLALYDQTPRLQGRSRIKINPLGESAEISSNDPRLLLRKGTGEGWAEVEFVAADGRRYGTRWSVHRARSKPEGNLQSQDLRFWSIDAAGATSELTGATKTETLGLIEEKLGLSFDQFGRSVLLAQGDFAAFVKASDSERADLLERMTNTSIYGRISEAAYARERKEREEIELLDARAGDLQVLDDGARELHGAWRQAAEARIAGAEAEIEEARSQVAWFEESDALTTRVEAAKEGVAAAQKAWDERADLRQELADVEEVAELRTPFTQLEGWGGDLEICRKALEGLNGESGEKTREAEGLAKALGENSKALEEARSARKVAEPVLKKARELDKEIEHADRALKAAKTGCKDAAAAVEKVEGEQASTAKKLEEVDYATGVHEAWKEAHRYVSGVAESWGLYRRSLAELAQARAEIEAHDAARADLGEAMERMRVDEKALAEQAAMLKSALVEEKEALDLRKQATPAGGFEALQKERRALDAAKKVAEEASWQVEAILKLEERRAELGKAQDELRVQDQAADAALTKHGVQLKVARERLEAERRALTAWQAAKSLDDHRRRLVEGEACPLCGAEDHPWRQDGALDPADEAQAQSARVEELERELQSLQRSQGELSARKAQLGEKLEALVDQAAAVDEELGAARSSWAKEQAEEPDAAAKGALDARVEALVRSQARIDERYEAMSKELQAIEAAQADLELSKARLDGVEAKLADQREELRGATSALEKVVGQLEVARRQRAKALDTLQEPFAGWPEWPSGFEADPEAFQSACEERVTRWIETAEALVELEETRRSLRQKGEELGARQAEKKADLEEKASAAARAGEASEALQEARRELLDGRPADEVQAELERAAAAAEKAHEAAREAKAQLEGAIDRLKGQIAEKMQTRDGLEQKLEEQGAELDAKLGELDLSREILEARLQRDEAWLRQTRQVIQQTKSAQEAATKLAEERDADRQSFREAKPQPACSREEAAARQAALKAEHDQVQRWCNELGRVLANDREARQKIAAIADELEAQRARHGVWKQLCDLIGSAGGNSFRRYAQSLTLEVLLGYANKHLSELKPRYRLQRIPKPNDHSQLSLQVVDRDMGDDIRSIESLSGGETFLVSLALALGLSSLTSNHTRVDSLFIDEGFGSLDAESLETAITTLDTLQSEGRTVGVISHVHGLAERIGKQIRVVPRGDGRSYIEYASGK